MTEPLFDPDKCDVPEVPKLDFDFVSECSIPAPPPPIFDCQAPMVPRDPPPVPCPVFDAQAVVRSAIARDSCSIPDGSEAATFVITQTDNDPCRFFLDLDLSVPIPEVPCPTITGGDVSLRVGYKDKCVDAATGAIVVHKDHTKGDCDTQDSCKFVIDLDLDIPIPLPPCPTITGGEVNITTVYGDNCPLPSSAIRISPEPVDPTCEDPGSCKFTIDLDLAIPIPELPCPELKASGAISFNPNLTAPTMVIQASGAIISSPCEPPQCELTIDVDIEIPNICPEFKATGSILKDSQLASPTMAIVIDKPDPNKCEFELDIDIQIPDICPEFKATGSILKDSQLTAPTMAIVIDKPDPNKCEFELDIDIQIPDICPTFKATGSILKDSQLASPTMAIVIDKPDPNKCEFELDIDIQIPDICPTIDATSAIVVTPGRSEPSGVLTVEKPDPTKCDFKIDLNLEFPPARPCPDYTGTVTVYEADEPTGTLEFQLTPPQAPDEPCFYDVTLEIGLPPPCVPEFNVEHNVFCTPGRDDVTCTKFEITKQSDKCEYAVALDIEMPCPRPCPTITATAAVYEASQPTGQLIVNHAPPTTPSEACVYELDLQIGVPSGKNSTLEKGTVVADWTVCTGTPTCDVVIDPPDDNGIQKIHIDIRVPQPPSYAGGTIDLGTLGSGVITIDGADPCNRVINAKIDLNTTNCPSGAT